MNETNEMNKQPVHQGAFNRRTELQLIYRFLLISGQVNK